MICDSCKEPAVAFYGKGKTTEQGTNLVAQEHLCYECYCYKYGLEEQP